MIPIVYSQAVFFVQDFWHYLGDVETLSAQQLEELALRRMFSS